MLMMCKKSGQVEMHTANIFQKAELWGFVH